MNESEKRTYVWCPRVLQTALEKVHQLCVVQDFRSVVGMLRPIHIAIINHSIELNKFK